MLNKPSFNRWAEQLLYHIRSGYNHQRYGDLTKWLSALEQIPELQTTVVELSNKVLIGASSSQINTQLEAALKCLIPWRKGPFEIHNIKLDTEWRSDWKWQRIEKLVDDLTHKRVLDIGCGNGYFMYRMLSRNPEMLIGIDPSLRFIIQFYMIKRLLTQHSNWQNPPIHMLPIGIEQLPEKLQVFDTVLSMGILYHRKSPIEHLNQCFNALKSGGQLILETLIVENEILLFPQERYAAMPNVWFIPNTDLLLQWLRRCKFVDIELIDITATTTQEQRQTPWMKFHSLTEFLDKNDSKLTIEGYPAPIRAIISARKP